jgi:hypothetical protein
MKEQTLRLLFGKRGEDIDFLASEAKALFSISWPIVLTFLLGFLPNFFVIAFCGRIQDGDLSLGASER